MVVVGQGRCAVDQGHRPVLVTAGEPPLRLGEQIVSRLPSGSAERAERLARHEFDFTEPPIDLEPKAVHIT